MLLEVQEGKNVPPHRRATTRVALTMPRMKQLLRPVHSRGDPRGRPAMGRHSRIYRIRQRSPPDASLWPGAPDGQRERTRTKVIRLHLREHLLIRLFDCFPRGHSSADQKGLDEPVGFGKLLAEVCMRRHAT